MLFYPWASNHYLPPLYHHDDRRVTKHMRGMEPRYNFWKQDACLRVPHGTPYLCLVITAGQRIPLGAAVPK